MSLASSGSSGGFPMNLIFNTYRLVPGELMMPDGRKPCVNVIVMNNYFSLRERRFFQRGAWHCGSWLSFSEAYAFIETHPLEQLKGFAWLRRFVEANVFAPIRAAFSGEGKRDWDSTTEEQFMRQGIRGRSIRMAGRVVRLE